MAVIKGVQVEVVNWKQNQFVCQPLANFKEEEKEEEETKSVALTIHEREIKRGLQE